MFSHDHEPRKMGRAALALALALGAAGCAEPSDPSGDAATPAADTPVAEEPGAGSAAPFAPAPPPVSDICPEGRRIGKMVAAGSCPTAPGWSKSKLFPAGSQAPLSLYCEYTWTGQGSPDVSAIPQDGDRDDWTQPDCMAVTTMAPSDAAEAAVKGSLNAAFWAAVDRPPSLPARPNPNAPPVRVAIIDSWPSVSVAGTSKHGLVMAGIVDDLVCDLYPVSCPVHIVPHLALNLIDPETIDEVNGGYYGFQSNLARKIEQAVSAAKDEQPLAKLVINLSVGWDRYFQNYVELPSPKMRPAATAVKDALEYAVCNGALVIAAAGNTSFGPDATDGLIYPAAWAPETAACPGNPRLVYPVSGLDARDHALYNARAEGITSLAAPGELATGTLPSTPVTTGPLTGSSVSAAVTAAAAATVWMYLDGKTPAEVMGLLEAGAVPLSLNATACAGPSPCGLVRRLSLCGTALLLHPGLPCTTHAEGTGVPAAWTPAQLSMVEAMAGEEFPGPALIHELEKPACSIPIFRRLTVNVPGPNACPIEQYANNVQMPITGPQPGTDPCGACALAVASPSEATLEVAVSSEMRDPVFAQTLTLFAGGSPVARYDISLLAYTDTYGDVHRVKDGLAPGSVSRLQLTGLTGDAALPLTADAAIIEWVDDVTGAEIQTSSRVAVFTR